MNLQELLHQRREELRSFIAGALGTSQLHSISFIARVLGEHVVRRLRDGAVMIDPHNPGQNSRYEGYPWLAAAGFLLGGAVTIPDALANEFTAGIAWLRQRPFQEMLVGDDIALLGIADGLARLASRSETNLQTEKTWFLELLSHTRPTAAWSGRFGELAADLLDERGRLRVRVDGRQIRLLACEPVLRAVWPSAFQQVPVLEPQDRITLSRHLLTHHAIPHEPEEACIWLRCLELLADEAVTNFVPTASDVARLLRNVQHGLKRWVWREKARRDKTQPSRWQIDDEYDVQSLLWTVLYPIFGAELVDEQYLPGWGLVQPRLDLGIKSLRLIIEVKIARTPRDFKKIEEEVAGDTGLYFKDPALFNRMIVFVYDDSDKPEPQEYDSLRNALVERSGIEDVIVVRRPSMLPDRTQRG
jgi:hypothetical protein